MNSVASDGVDEILRESIALEKTLEEFYAFLSDAFPEDRDFWLKISSEEHTHAGLLQAFYDGDLPLEKLPINLLGTDLTRVQSVRASVVAKLASFKKKTPDKEMAYGTVFFFEQESVELYYQFIMSRRQPTHMEELMRRLNGDSKDHAERIRGLMGRYSMFSSS